MRTSSWDDPGAIGSSTITAPASRVWASSAFPCCATTSCRCSTGHAPISPCDCLTGRRRSRTRSRSEEHTSELQSQSNLVCRLLLEKKKKYNTCHYHILLLTTTFMTCLAFACP